MLSCGKYHVRILPKNIKVNYFGIDDWIVHRVHEKAGDSYVWDTEDWGCLGVVFFSALKAKCRCCNNFIKPKECWLFLGSHSLHNVDIEFIFETVSKLRFMLQNNLFQTFTHMTIVKTTKWVLDIFNVFPHFHWWLQNTRWINDAVFALNSNHICENVCAHRAGYCKDFLLRILFVKRCYWLLNIFIWIRTIQPGRSQFGSAQTSEIDDDYVVSSLFPDFGYVSYINRLWVSIEPWHNEKQRPTTIIFLEFAHVIEVDLPTVW